MNVETDGAKGVEKNGVNAVKMNSKDGVGKQKRTCIIGAGPAGMSTLYQHSMLETEDKPEVVVYEKQGTWGGMWNFTWRTGTDEFGEPCHGGMYKNLWSNGPKEALEYDDYSFDEHFGKATPTFLPRSGVKQYMEERWTKKAKSDLRTLIKFNHAVRYVTYDSEAEEFQVSVADLKTKAVHEETFSHVVVAVGIFSAPHRPYFEGIEDFHGRILHAHDLRAAHEFKDKRVLLVGGSLSAEDISVMCLKYGAKSVVCSWHKAPTGLKWPKGIEERPPIKHVSVNTVTFVDDTSTEFDAIILCTGYIYKFPFLEDSLQLTSHTSFYPDNLYKGMVWMKGGNKKLFYIGVQNQLYTLPMFDVQATWIWRYILRELPNEPRTSKAMDDDKEKWLQRNNAVATRHDAVEFQTDYLTELIELTGRDSDILKAQAMIHSWIGDREENLATFRDKCFASVHTGQMAVEQEPWMQNFENQE